MQNILSYKVIITTSGRCIDDDAEPRPRDTGVRLESHRRHIVAGPELPVDDGADGVVASQRVDLGESHAAAPAVVQVHIVVVGLNLTRVDRVWRLLIVCE